MTDNSSPNLEIIAELAQGFEGKPDYARLLVLAAAKAGATSAKMQLVYADELATPDYEYYELFRSMEMEDSVWVGLKDQCKELGIELFVDIFGTKSLALADRLNISTVKLHATDTTNIGFLKQVADSGLKRVVIGVGGARLSEVEAALDILANKEVIVFHGFQGYPTPLEDNQMERIPLLHEKLVSGRDNVRLGFADHADPLDMTAFSLPAAALGMGVRVFEKHLTLGRNMEMEDHEAALNPDQFETFANCLRMSYTALGTVGMEDDFGMAASEENYRNLVRRHVVAKMDIPIGTVITPDMVELKRSACPDPIFDIQTTYGKTLKEPVDAGAALVQASLTS